MPSAAAAQTFSKSGATRRTSIPGGLCSGLHCSGTGKQAGCASVKVLSIAF